MHWAQPYIGKPWKIDGFGPDAFSCWGLLWHIYKNRLGIELPKYTDTTQLEIARQMRAATMGTEWYKLRRPIDGCAVGLSSHLNLHHVGVFLSVDGGMVLHACEGKGVICQSVTNLASQGWNKVEFYLHSQWPISLK